MSERLLGPLPVSTLVRSEHLQENEATRNNYCPWHKLSPHSWVLDGATKGSELDTRGCGREERWRWLMAVWLDDLRNTSGLVLWNLVLVASLLYWGGDRSVTPFDWSLVLRLLPGPSCNGLLHNFIVRPLCPHFLWTAGSSDIFAIESLMSCEYLRNGFLFFVFVLDKTMWLAMKWVFLSEHRPQERRACTCIWGSGCFTVAVFT